MAPEATSQAAPLASSSLLGLAGFAGTFTLTYFETGTTRFDYQGGFLLSALSAAAIIMAAVCVPKGPIARTLSLRPLVWIGTISYGAYLWHYPVFVYFDAARTGQVGFSLLVIRFAATFALATASFYLVERPVMYGTFWRQLKAAIPATALIVATVAVVMAGTVADASANPTATPVPIPAGRPGAGRVPVLLTGDSTALTLGLALSYAADRSKDGIDVIDKATTGCGVAEGRTVVSDGVVRPVPAPCNPSAPADQQWPALLEQQLSQYRPRVVILLAGRWEVYNRSDLAGRTTNITDPGYARYVQSELQRFVDVASSKGARVVLMTAPYYGAGEEADGQPLPEDQPQRVRDYNRLVSAVVRANPQTTTLSRLNAIVCPDGHFTLTIGSVVVRASDGVHFPFFTIFSAFGPGPDTVAQVNEFGEWIGPKILPPIVRLALG